MNIESTPLTKEIYNYKRFNCHFSKKTNTVYFYDILPNKKRRYYDPVTQCFFDDSKYFNYIDDLSIFEPYQGRSPESMVAAMKYQFNKFNQKEYVIPFKSVLNKCAMQVRYEDLEGTDEDKKVNLYVPIKLSDEMIHDAMMAYKEKYEPDFEYDMEYAKAFVGLVAFEYMFQKAKRRNKIYLTDREFYSNHFKSYVQLRSNYLEKILSYKFESYRLAYIHAGILLCDDKWFHFDDSKKARSYKLANFLFDVDSSSIDVKQYYTFNPSHWRLRYRLAEHKIAISKKRKMTDENYKEMIKDATELFLTMNTSEMLTVYNSNPYAYYNLAFGDNKGLKKKLKDKDEIKIEEFINTIEFIQQGNTYFNVCDKFGGRFHSVFTNIKSWVRQFINVDGVKYISADAKNSQMAIFAMIIEHPEVVMDMMKGTEWLKHSKDDNVLLPFADIFAAIQYAKEHSDNNKKDIDKFIGLSKAGLLYEEIATIIKKDRDNAKGCVFRTFFSNDIQFKDLKNKLSVEFPTMVGLISYLNQEGFVPHLPKLLQKVESELFVNRIFKRFMEVKKHPAITIHDSVMFHPDDLDVFNQVYHSVFEELGIPPLVLKYDDYNMMVEK